VEPLPERDSQSVKADVGIAAGSGVSAGTLLAALANNLSDANQLKSWLVILAPAVGVGLSTLLIWLQAWNRRRIAEKKMAA
jgi:hypothetical protein